MVNKNNFDFLRFVAASMVIIAHAFPLSEGNIDNELLMLATNRQMDFGTLGVAIFFVISGYLITKSYDRRNDIRFFVKARVLRMIPALTLVTLISVFLLGPFLTTLSLSTYFTDWQTLKYLANISAVRISYYLPGVFEANVYKGAVNGSLWTIPYEILCYVMVAILGLTKQLKAKIIIPIFVFAIVISAIKSIILINLSKYFIAGMVLYSLRDKIPMSKNIAIFCTAVILISSQLGQLKNIMPLVGSYLVIYIAFSQDIKFHKFGKYGDCSYGIYIYAFPAQQIITHIYGGSMNPYLNIFISFPIILVLAMLSWIIVEEPCLSLKNKQLINVSPSNQLKYLLVASIIINIVFLGATTYPYISNSVAKSNAFIDYNQKALQNPFYLPRTSVFNDLPSNEGSIVFLGDSLIDLFEWHESLGSNIKNRGIAGDRTYGVINRLDDVVRLKPISIFIMIGTNDIIEGRNVEDIGHDYDKILNILTKELPDTKIIVHSVLPINYNMFGKVNSKNNDNIILLNDEIKLLSKHYNLQYVDLYNQVVYNGQLHQDLTTDGVHLNGKGYEIWSNTIKQYL